MIRLSPSTFNKPEHLSVPSGDVMSISGKAAHGQQSWARTATNRNVPAVIFAVKQANRVCVGSCTTDSGKITAILRQLACFVGRLNSRRPTQGCGLGLDVSVSRRANVSSRSRRENNCQRLRLGHLRLVPETNLTVS